MEDVAFFPSLLQLIIRDAVATRGDTLGDVSVDLLFLVFPLKAESS